MYINSFVNGQEVNKAHNILNHIINKMCVALNRLSISPMLPSFNKFTTSIMKPLNQLANCMFAQKKWFYKFSVVDVV